MEANNEYHLDVLMGDAQQHTRLCAMWHYPFIIQPLSLIFRQAPEEILAAINDRFDTQVQPNVYKMTEERIVLSFPNHWEAVQAFRLASEGDAGVRCC